jgi:hypothetical protein
MSRPPRCRGCGDLGGWICPACSILEQYARSNGLSFKDMGIIEDQRAGDIRRREVPLVALKGRYG